MNPIRFLLLLAIAVLISSCAKDHPTLVNTATQTQSSIEFIYPDDSDTGGSDVRIASFNPPSTSQPCKSNTPSILVPRILVGESIEIIYANIEEFSANVDPKSIKWNVNGETKLQLTTTLKLPYAIGVYAIEVIVTLEDGTEREYEFVLDVTHDIPLDNEGYIGYNPNDLCVTGEKVGPSCLPLNGRAARVIIIIDPIE